MELTKNDKELLKSWGYENEDIKQIERATGVRFTKYKVDNKEISIDEAITLLGREEFLSGISRSAFHWSSARTTKNGKTVLFDSSRLFK